MSLVKEGEDPGIVKELQNMENKFTIYDCTKLNKVTASQQNVAVPLTSSKVQIPMGTSTNAVKASETHSHYTDVMEGRDHEALNAKIAHNNSVDQSSAFTGATDSPTKSCVPPLSPLPSQQEDLCASDVDEKIPPPSELHSHQAARSEVKPITQQL